MKVSRLARYLLPRVILNRLGNRNTIKRATTDRIFFRVSEHPAKKVILETRSKTIGVAEDVLEKAAFIPATVKKDFRCWYDHQQLQHVIKVKDIYIEPTTGWPMNSRNRLFLDLMPTGISPYMPTPPSHSVFRKQPIQSLDRAIVLRDLVEIGYSHFYTDILSKIALVEQTGIELKEYDLVISDTIAKRPYASEMIHNTRLFRLAKSVVLQKNQWIRCREAVFSGVFVHPTEAPQFWSVVEAVQGMKKNNSNDKSDRVFLVRGATDRRRLRNQHQIFEILRDKNFIAVETGNMTFSEQIDVFSGCRHLVGIHGAGLANMIYRAGKQMSLFEITEPANARPLPRNPLYHNMAVACGFDYGAVEAETISKTDQSIELSAKSFQAAFEPFWHAVHRQSSGV